MYHLLRNLLFLFPAEAVHHFSMNILRVACKIPLFKKWLASSFSPQNVSLRKELLGLKFKNPVGLAAGFDKNALYLNELETLGFGFVEIGTVTPKPQAGNEKPRLFRLPKDKALINRMGFNNDGVHVVARRLKKWKEANGQSPAAGDHKTADIKKTSTLIIGGNIGKNKTTPNEDAWKDYEICFRELFDCVDYFVVNVSSPNTPGLRELQGKESLRKILSHLQAINNQLAGFENSHKKPLLLKIAPDLTQEQIDDVIDLALEIKLDGLVATNTTINRKGLITSNTVLQNIGTGGLSGAPLKNASTEMVKYIHQKTNGAIPVIASGGIFSGSDAKEKLQSGAVLLQVWTGFIYEGPAIVKNICNDLVVE